MDTIFELLDCVTIRQAVWLIPVVGLIHVAEELPRFVPWARRFLHPGYTKTKFVVENIVLFAISLGGVLLTAFTELRIGLILVLGAALGFLLNAVFHVGLTLRTREYSPGTVTAVLLFVPSSVLLIVLAARASLLDLDTVLPAVLLGVGLLPAVIFVVHGLVDRTLLSRSKLKTLAIGGVPFVLVPLLIPLVGEERMGTAMLYSAPLVLLPLVVKTAAKLKERRGR